MLLPLLPMQYARYAPSRHGAAAARAGRGTVVGHAAAPRGWLVAGLCVLNLAFQANAHWFLHTGGIKRSVAVLGRDQPLFARYVPERALAAVIRDARAVDGTVLVIDPAIPYYAELAGRGRGTAWYDPQLEAARHRGGRRRRRRGLGALLRRERIAEVLLRPASLQPAQRAGLPRAGARRELTVGEAQWWRIPLPDERHEPRAPEPPLPRRSACVQWLLDWGVMVGLSHLGMPVEAANIAGRISGATAGLLAQRPHHLRRRRHPDRAAPVRPLRDDVAADHRWSAPGRSARSTTLSG